MEKHYVYSARTTEKGLALLNKTKGDTGWDAFVNTAVAAHYGLNIDDLNLPPSPFLAERAAAKAKRDAEKATKKAEAEKAKKAKAEAKAAADKVKKAAAKKATPVKPAAKKAVKKAVKALNDAAAQELQS